MSLLQLAKKKRRYKVPKFVALDLRQYPLLVKLDFAALFLGVVALTLPFWCRVSRHVVYERHHFDDIVRMVQGEFTLLWALSP